MYTVVKKRISVTITISLGGMDKCR